jgi:outer membrane lipoprotein-sorting protein
MRKLASFVLVLLAACHRQAEVGGPAGAPARAEAITSADQLVAAMHDRYAGKWYRNLTFVQKSTFLRPDGTPSRVETWYEAGAIPGRLRIDLGELSRGNGVVYRNDSVYSIAGGRIAQRQVGRNVLMVLGFDVYAQPVARTLEQLKAERIDITLLHTDNLNGRRVYVVGAGPTDSTSNQFWIDADRMLFVRLIQTDPTGKNTRDIRFEKYVQHDGGWVSEEVRVLAGGRLTFLEQYSDVRVNVPLDEDLFIAEKWSTATHWFKP